MPPNCRVTHTHTCWASKSLCQPCNCGKRNEKRKNTPTTRLPRNATFNTLQLLTPAPHGMLHLPGEMLVSKCIALRTQFALPDSIGERFHCSLKGWKHNTSTALYLQHEAGLAAENGISTRMPMVKSWFMLSGCKVHQRICQGCWWLCAPKVHILLCLSYNKCTEMAVA